MRNPSAKTLQAIVNKYIDKITQKQGFTHYLGKNKQDCFIIGLTDNDLAKLEPLSLQNQVSKWANVYGLENITIGGRYSDEKNMYCLDVGYAMDIKDNSYNKTRVKAMALGMKMKQECIVEIAKGKCIDFINC